MRIKSCQGFPRPGEPGESRGGRFPLCQHLSSVTSGLLLSVSKARVISYFHRRKGSGPSDICSVRGSLRPHWKHLGVLGARFCLKAGIRELWGKAVLRVCDQTFKNGEKSVPWKVRHGERAAARQEKACNY